MILVTGATGHVGSELVAQLAAGGHAARAMTRRPQAARFPDGIDVVGGDFTDGASLDAALRGVDRVFAMSVQPAGSAPAPTDDLALVAACRRAGVQRIARLSVLDGGGTDPGDPIVRWIGEIEGAVRDSGAAWTLLRPGRFMSNALGWAPMIRRGDDVHVPFATRPAASIDPADIAAVAALALTEDGHAGATYELSGPQTMTPIEEIRVLGELLGRPLRPIAMTPAATRDAMLRHGMPEAVVERGAGADRVGPRHGRAAHRRPGPRTSRPIVRSLGRGPPGSVRMSGAGPAGGERRWLALVFIALAQLMVALDATIVSVALPTVQRALDSTDAERQWIITAYLLAFAGLLLLGGRIADSIGRRRAFLIGLAGFAASSALAGMATTMTALAVARAMQGASAALLSPTALSLLAVTFTERRDRARAFAVFGGVAGSGGALGLILGGWLTQSFGWRWCLYVNVAFAAVAFAGARLTLPASAPGGRARVNVVSALLATAGLAAVVFGCAGALEHGWTSGTVLARFAIGLVALAVFVDRQRRSAAPLLPLHVVIDRNRGGAAVAAGLAVVAMFGIFLLLTYYFQVVRRYSPLEAGLAFLPMSAAGLLGSTLIAGRLLQRVAPRVLMIGGLTIAAAGMASLMRMTGGIDYATGIVPAEMAAGFGISCAMIAAFSVATHGVAPRDAGVASAVIVTAQQVGGSIGTALLNTVAASASAAFLISHPGGAPSRALVHGYALATAWGCAVLIAAAVVAGVLVTAGKPTPR